MVMCLDEMWLCLQQQINVLVTMKLCQFASLQWIPFSFQRHKRQPVRFLLHCMQRHALNLTTAVLLTLQITGHNSCIALHTLKATVTQSHRVRQETMVKGCFLLLNLVHGTACLPTWTSSNCDWRRNRFTDFTTTHTSSNSSTDTSLMRDIYCGPEVLFETCVAMKFVDDDDDWLTVPMECGYLLNVGKFSHIWYLSCTSILA